MSPGELARALDAYRGSGSYAEAARAVGRDESTVRKALRRSLAPERAELMAAALEEAHAASIASCERARVRVLAELEDARDPRAVADLARTLADLARAVTVARVAVARLAPEEEPRNVADPSEVERLHELMRRAIDAAREEGRADALAALQGGPPRPGGG